MWIWGYMLMSAGAFKGQGYLSNLPRTRFIDRFELLMFMLGTKLRFSAGAVCDLKHWVISPAPPPHQTIHLLLKPLWLTFEQFSAFPWVEEDTHPMTCSVQGRQGREKLNKYKLVIIVPIFDELKKYERKFSEFDNNLLISAVENRC